MLSCLVPRYGQEDKINMPSSTAFSLQFPSLASSLHHHNNLKNDDNSSLAAAAAAAGHNVNTDYVVKCPQCHQRLSGFFALREHLDTEHPQEKQNYESSVANYLHHPFGNFGTALHNNHINNSTTNSNTSNNNHSSNSGSGSNNNSNGDLIDSHHRRSNSQNSNHHHHHHQQQQQQEHHQPLQHQHQHQHQQHHHHHIMPPSIGSPSPPISTTPIGSASSGPNDLTLHHHHHHLQQQHQHQQQQQQHLRQQHAMAMALAAAATRQHSPPNSLSSLNGITNTNSVHNGNHVYDEHNGGRSTSSPGSSTNMGDLCNGLGVNVNIGGSIAGPGGPHPCTQCTASFPTRDHLEKHEIMHSPSSQVSCKICHKHFANVYRLQRHMISHDESVLLRKFKCTECDKAFKFKHHLKEHVRIHSGEKPFGCDNCGKRFSHSGSFSSHMTSKKCISMGLKLNSNRSLMKLEKSLLTAGGNNTNSKRNNNNNNNNNVKNNNNNSNYATTNPLNYYPTGLSNLPNVAATLAAAASNNNNNNNNNNNVITHNGNSSSNIIPPPLPPPNPNAFYPMLPKYNNYDAAAVNAALLASFHQNPFYSMAALDPRINPYGIHRLLELSATASANNVRLHTNPDDMIEEVIEDDVIEEPKLIMDLEDHENNNELNKNNNNNNNITRPNSPITSNNNPSTYNEDDEEDEEQNENVMEENVMENNNMNLIIPKVEPRDPSPCLENDRNESPIVKVEETRDENDDDDNEEDNNNKTEEEHNNLACSRCAKKFNHQTELVQHEKVLCGLINDHEPQQHQQQQQQHQQQQQSVDSELVNSSSVYLQSGSDDEIEDHESKNGSESERKVRVRTAITEEQQTILKEHYAINARPSRDEFRVIANRLGLDPRVVQVWFQNNRSRERKMNNYNNLSNGSSSKYFASPLLAQSPPSYSPSIQSNAVIPGIIGSNGNSISSPETRNTSTTIEEQPLDLSVKKESPIKKLATSSSPRRGHAPILQQTDLNEAINLSCRKTKNSKSSKQSAYLPTSVYCSNASTATPYQHSNDIGGIIRQTPSPPSESMLPSIRNQQNPYVLPPGTRGLVPMECLLQMTPDYARNQIMGSLKLGGGECGTSLSPGSEKRSWRDDDSRVSHDDEYLMHGNNKKFKLDTNTSTNGNNHNSNNTNGVGGDLDLPFVCDRCDKAFSKQSSLARHKYEHSGQRPYQCVECPKAFKHKHHLTEHKRLHSGEKPFQCSKCLKRFSHSGSYSQHMNHRYSYCKPYRE